MLLDLVSAPKQHFWSRDLYHPPKPSRQPEHPAIRSRRIPGAGHVGHECASSQSVDSDRRVNVNQGRTKSLVAIFQDHSRSDPDIDIGLQSRTRCRGFPIAVPVHHDLTTRTGQGAFSIIASTLWPKCNWSPDHALVPSTMSW